MKRKLTPEMGFTKMGQPIERVNQPLDKNHMARER